MGDNNQGCTRLGGDTTQEHENTIKKRGKKTITIKDDKKWGQGRKLEARKSKRETGKTKQKTENTQKNTSHKGRKEKQTREGKRTKARETREVRVLGRRWRR
jgi:hypothetical protein